MMGAEVTTDHKWVALEDEVIAHYNTRDTYGTARLYHFLRGGLQNREQLGFYQTEVEPTIDAACAIMGRGLPIDTGERTQLRRRFRAEVRACDKVVCAAAGHPYRDMFSGDGGPFNPNSDTQVRRWLFGGDRTTKKPGEQVEVIKGVNVACLGLKPAGKTEAKAWSVDQDNLLRVLRDLRKMDEPHRPTLLALLHRSRYVKLDEYLDFEVEDRGDGDRVYPTIKLHGTKTLRWSYADPPCHSWAEEMRTMVAPREGRSLVKADFSALEARLAAYLSGDELDIKVFEQPDRKYDPNGDIHTALVFDCFPEVKARWGEMPDEDKDLYRNHAKTVRFGTFLYGGEPESAKTKTFCACGDYEGEVEWTKCKGRPPTLSLTDQRKRAIVDAWMSKHVKFVEWRNKLVRAFEGAHATHHLTSALGWRRFFSQPFGGELLREVYNWPIQHAGALLKLRALVGLHRAGVPLVFDHHDALVAEVEDAEVFRTARMMREVMETPVPELGGARFPVDVKVGKNWKDLH